MEIKIDKFDGSKMLVNRQYRELLEKNNLVTADSLWNLSGESVKNVVKERATERCQLTTVDGNIIDVFIKRYLPIPFKEKLKNRLYFKPFNFTAIHEWEAIMAFHRHQLPTMIPLAVAELPDGRSCNLTLGITHYQRVSEWLPKLNDATRKQQLINNTAEYMGKMHRCGMAHQDFYLVHMFIREQEADRLYMIDLQRVLMQKTLQRRWRVKDLAQLLFAAADYVDQTEIAAFWTKYCEFAGSEYLNCKSLTNAIKRKAERIHRHDAKRAARRKQKSN
jgi:tRNA A-37 threonylcarbamoyl transferase component Bud32